MSIAPAAVPLLPWMKMNGPVISSSGLLLPLVTSYQVSLPAGTPSSAAVSGVEIAWITIVAEVLSPLSKLSSGLTWSRGRSVSAGWLAPVVGSVSTSTELET
jgi:hypothetical protein